VLSVLFDATAVPADRRGVGRYIDSLIPQLAGAGVEVEVLCRPEDAAHYSELSGRPAVHAPAIIGRRPARLVWEQLVLPWTVRRRRPDVLHSPHYTHPVLLGALSSVPLVVTLHDATFFSDPQVHTRVKGPFFRVASRLALRRAAVCVVPSQATADELVRIAGADADRLVVAHLGVDTGVFHRPGATETARVRGLLGLAPDEDYVAFLGTLEPRKNVPALVRGWARACAGRDRPPALVLAGGAGWNTDLDAVAAQLPSGLRLLRPGYLPLEDLPGLLGGATVVAYPSLGEGFGLPVLEAMACGAPVLTTRRLSLAEVGGTAVAYCGTDEVSIAAGLAGLLDDPARRAELGAAGAERAAGFSWAACAEAHVAAYRRAVEVDAARTHMGRR
jgi:glycosyltransferase involved in cell wall biosynthesis